MYGTPLAPRFEHPPAVVEARARVRAGAAAISVDEYVDLHTLPERQQAELNVRAVCCTIPSLFDYQRGCGMEPSALVAGRSIQVSD